MRTVRLAPNPMSGPPAAASGSVATAGSIATGLRACGVPDVPAA
ncbi:MAG: hypothetical protein ACT4O0_02560 [Pseudonocardia sp.]